jgi:hypothetical protein
VAAPTTGFSTTTTASTPATPLATTTTEATLESTVAAVAPVQISGAEGLYLDIVTADGELVEFDLGSGTRSTLGLPRVNGEAWNSGMVALANGLVIVRGEDVFAVPYGSGRVEPLAETAFRFLSGGRMTAVLVTPSPDGRAGATLVDGSLVTAPATLPPSRGNALWEVGHVTVDGRLPFSLGGRVGVRDLTSGRVEDLAGGTLVATGDNAVIYSTCDGGGSCRSVLYPFDGTAQRQVDVPTAGVCYARPQVSPDNRWLLLHEAGGTGRGLRLVDLSSGEARSLGGPQTTGPPVTSPASFSPNGRFLAVRNDSGLAVWDLAAGTQVAVIDKLTVETFTFAPAAAVS